MFLKAPIFYVWGSTPYRVYHGSSCLCYSCWRDSSLPGLPLVSHGYFLCQCRVLVIYLLKVYRFYILPLWLVLKLLQFK